jgi:hypothetical protein
MNSNGSLLYAILALLICPNLRGSRKFFSIDFLLLRSTKDQSISCHPEVPRRISFSILLCVSKTTTLPHRDSSPAAQNDTLIVVDFLPLRPLWSKPDWKA